MSEAADQPIRYVHGLFCEDLRQEVGGTASYVGVLTESLQLDGGFPNLIRRLTVIAWIVYPVSEPDPGVTLKLEIPGGDEEEYILTREEAAEAKASDTPIDTDITLNQSQVAIEFENIAVPQPGRLRLRVTAWGKTWTAASLAIIAAA